MSDRLTLNLTLSPDQIEAIARHIVELRSWPERMSDAELLLSLRAGQLHAERRERDSVKPPGKRPICAECLVYRAEPGLRVCPACKIAVRLVAAEERGVRRGWREAVAYYGITEQTPST